MSVMDLINDIRTKALGRDVREAIASAIERCYSDATTQQSNMEISAARGNKSSLSDRLNAESYMRRINGKKILIVGTSNEQDASGKWATRFRQLVDGVAEVTIMTPAVGNFSNCMDIVENNSDDKDIIIVCQGRNEARAGQSLGNYAAPVEGTFVYGYNRLRNFVNTMSGAKEIFVVGIARPLYNDSSSYPISIDLYRMYSEVCTHRAGAHYIDAWDGYGNYTASQSGVTGDGIHFIPPYTYKMAEHILSAVCSSRSVPGFYASTHSIPVEEFTAGNGFTIKSANMRVYNGSIALNVSLTANEQKTANYSNLFRLGDKLRTVYTTAYNVGVAFPGGGQVRHISLNPDGNAFIFGNVSEGETINYNITMQPNWYNMLSV